MSPVDLPEAEPADGRRGERAAHDEQELDDAVGLTLLEERVAEAGGSLDMRLRFDV
ncbi:MAG TPA: hypothetical protein VND88_13105 [Candidatus Acidoferrales bacterium]|nr:hypothetical protein [Candidatus Acidoferrales bacterium]